MERLAMSVTLSTKAVTRPDPKRPRDYVDRKYVKAACEQAMLKLHVDWVAQICKVGRGAKHPARVSRMGT